MTIPNPQPCPHCDVSRTGDHAPTCPDAPRFILWDRKDGDRPLPGSDGILGKLTLDNAYLTAYANWPDKRRPRDLPVGGVIRAVCYRLSGGSGAYDLWRVQ